MDSFPERSPNRPVRSRGGDAVSGALGAAAVASFRRPWRALALVAFSVVLGASGAARLRLSADLSELLPDSYQSVRDIETLRERVGGIGYVVVTLRGGTPESLRRFARDAAREIAKLEAVRYVDFKRPTEFFRDRALYFLEPADLAILEQRIAARKEWEIAHRSPLYLDLGEDEEPPSIDFSDLEKKYRARGPASLGTDGGADVDYYLDPNQPMIALFVKPDSLSADLGFAQSVVTQVERTVRSMDLGRYGKDLELGFTGSYTRRVEQQALITRDLRFASSVAALLMVAFLGWHFRRAAAVLLVVGPLGVGLVWTFGIAEVAFGQLNILTGFLGAILLGLGIDHGIHLLGRYQDETRAGAEEEAVVAAFAGTGRAAGVAALTTVAAFVGLAFSEFRAFHEFGVIAAVGMVAIFASYVVCLPALLKLVPFASRTISERVGLTGAWLAHHSGVVLAACGFVAVLATAGLERLSFDYDFRSIQGANLPSFALDARVTELLGRSQSPVVIATDSVGEERAVAEAVRRDSAFRGHESTVDFALAISDLVPTEQARKRRLLEELEGTLAKIKPGWLEPTQRNQLEDLRRMARARPFSRDELPREVTRQFTADGHASAHGVVLVFPSVEQNDGRQVRALARQLRAIELPDGSALRPAAEAMILADILDGVSDEGPTILLVTLGLVLAVLVLLLAGPADAALCFGSGAATVALALGALPLFGVQLNYLNIIIIPVLFGLGVDGAVHLVVRWRAGAALPILMSETGRAVTGSILTTALGFGALLLADHSGLESIGQFALIGLASNALVSLVGVPCVLAVAARSRVREAEAH